MSNVIEQWLKDHIEFTRHESSFPPEELRRKALYAIEVSGQDGASMAMVHQAVKSKRPAAAAVGLIVDRLVADGHVHRVTIQTAGRPRVQMWAFRHVLEDPDAQDIAFDMAQRGVSAECDYRRLRWAGKSQQYLIREVLGAARDRDLDVKGLIVAAGQVYVDADAHLIRAMFKGAKNDRGEHTAMTNREMDKFLWGMAQQRLIDPGYRSTWRVGMDVGRIPG